MHECPECGEDTSGGSLCEDCEEALGGEEELFDADELGLDPETDDERRY